MFSVRAPGKEKILLVILFLLEMRSRAVFAMTDGSQTPVLMEGRAVMPWVSGDQRQAILAPYEVLGWVGLWTEFFYGCFLGIPLLQNDLLGNPELISRKDFENWMGWMPDDYTIKSWQPNVWGWILADCFQGNPGEIIRPCYDGCVFI